MVNTGAGVRKLFPIASFLTAAVFAASSSVLARATLASTDSGGKPEPARVSGRPGATTPPAISPLALGISIDCGDLLRIDVFDVPELSGTYRVHSGGRIDMPLLRKPIQAAGLSTDQLAAILSDDLQRSGLVSHPQVTVEVKESLARSITIAGAVKKPVTIPVYGRITLLDAISAAGGLAGNAGSVATITRGKSAMAALVTSTSQTGPATGQPRVTNVDLRRLMETGDPRLNRELFAGDRVLVVRAGVIYVVGAVNRAGGFLLTDDKGPMTILKAIALAEGLKSTAVADKSLILRQSAGSRTQAPVRLRDVLAGRAPDQRLEANDILFVPDSNSQKAIRRGAEAAVEIATGIMIWRL